jgi:hypothetical protein
MIKAVDTVKGIVFSMAIASLAVPVAVNAEDTAPTIKPFGNFTWSDGFLDALKTAQAIPGVEKVDFKVGEIISADPKVTDRQIKMMLSERYAGEMLQRSLSNATTGGFVCKQSKDASFPYFIYKGEMKVSPIMISGVPFTAEMEFSASCGLAIAYPDKVLTDGTGKVMIPLKLTSLTLTSTSPLLGANITNIGNAMKEKYKDFPPNPFGMQNMFFHDDHAQANENDAMGNTVAIDCKADACSISYRTSNRDMDAAYKKHLADMESANNAGKSDLSSGL